MTTAARPTWAPAKGGNEQGGTRIFGPSQKYSSRDIAAHTTLKPRKEGQDTKDELQRRNLRDEFEDRERRHFPSKVKRLLAEWRDVGILYIEIVFGFMDLGKWLLAFVMHQLMSTQSACLIHNLISAMKIKRFIEREMNEVASRAEFMFSEVLNALCLLVERKAESGDHLADLEKMLQNEKSEFEESLHKILNKEAKEGQPAMDILELNRLRRQLVFHSYMWDHRLIYANSLDYKSQSGRYWSS